MAAAAAVTPSISLHSSLTTRLLSLRNSQLHFSISPTTKPLLFKSLLLPSLPRPLQPAAAASSDAAAAAYDDEEEFEDEESEDIEEEQEQQQSLRPSSVQQEEGRLYVGNLPYTMTPAELAEIFGQAGTVDAVEVVYDRVTDRSRGFAFVTMASAADASEAIRMFDGTQVGGRTVKVNFPEVPRGGEREVMGPRARSSSRGYMDSPHKLYAGNLGWTVSSEALKEAFASQNGVLGAKVIYDRDSGRSRGFGFVSFASAEDVEAAMEAMNGVEVDGRPLRLNTAQTRSPAAIPSAIAANSEEGSSTEAQTESEVLTSA